MAIEGEKPSCIPFKPTSEVQVQKMAKTILRNHPEKPIRFIEHRTTNPTPVTS